MKPPPILFRRVWLLVPLPDRFSLPENPAGAWRKDKSFFLKYKAFFNRKREISNKYLLFYHNPPNKPCK